MEKSRAYKSKPIKPRKKFSKKYLIIPQITTLGLKFNPKPK